MKKILVKAVPQSCSLQLSLPVILKCFLMFSKFQPQVSYKKCVTVILEFLQRSCVTLRSLLKYRILILLGCI